MATAPTERTIRDLVFAGFNRRVFALDRYTGEVVWKWKAPEGTGFVTVLLDGDRLMVSVNGYMYCLDPLYGQVVWSNPLKGFGVGVTSLTSVHGSVNGAEAAAAAAQQQQQAAAAAAT
jgi:outer membrane protein assembly factor BamB